MKSTELERAVAQLQEVVRETQVRLRDHELRFVSIAQRLGWPEDWERNVGPGKRKAP